MPYRVAISRVCRKVEHSFYFRAFVSLGVGCHVQIASIHGFLGWTLTRLGEDKLSQEPLQRRTEERNTQNRTEQHSDIGCEKGWLCSSFLIYQLWRIVVQCVRAADAIRHDHRHNKGSSEALVLRGVTNEHRQLRYKFQRTLLSIQILEKWIKAQESLHTSSTKDRRLAKSDNN